MKTLSPPACVVVTPYDDTTTADVMLLANAIRERDISCLVDFSFDRMKRKIGRADKIGAYYFISIGPNEILSGNVSVKDFDENKNIIMMISEVPDFLYKNLRSYSK